MVCVSRADSDLFCPGRSSRSRRRLEIAGAIFGRAMAEAEEAPPVAEDAPVEAAVEAEAPAEDTAVEGAPASDTPDQTETPADDDAEAETDPKEGAEEGDDAGRSGDEAPGETDGEPEGEPEADAEHTEGETRDAGDVDEPLEGAEGADTAVGPGDDESEWDTLTRLGLFKASSHASIDDLVDELVDQSMEMSGSDLDESMENLDELYAQAPVVTREDPAAKEAETLATLERLRQDLLAKNETLEKAIAAHISKTKGNAYSTSPPASSTEQTTEDTPNPAEAAQRKIRYRNALAGWRTKSDELQFAKDEFQASADEINAELALRTRKQSETFAAFVAYKAEVAKAAEYPGAPGKGLSEDVIERRLNEEKVADDSARKARLLNAKLRRRLANTEEKVRDKEELAAGLFLVDFEQLKIENGALQEKIDARNGDLVRMRSKTGAQVQALTHMKEKLQHVRKENERVVRELATLAEESDKKGDHMRRLKAERDRYKKENERMQAASNTVDVPVLLDDYRFLKQKSAHLKQKTARLRRMCTEAQTIKASRTPRSGTNSKTPAGGDTPKTTAPVGGRDSVVGFF